MSPYSGKELYDMLLADDVPIADIAEMGIDDLAEEVYEVRRMCECDDIDLDYWEIAEHILEFAQRESKED